MVRQLQGLVNTQESIESTLGHRGRPHDAIAPFDVFQSSLALAAAISGLVQFHRKFAQRISELWMVEFRKGLSGVCGVQLSRLHGLLRVLAFLYMLDCLLDLRAVFVHRSRSLVRSRSLSLARSLDGLLSLSRSHAVSLCAPVAVALTLSLAPSPSQSLTRALAATSHARLLARSPAPSHVRTFTRTLALYTPPDHSLTFSSSTCRPQAESAVSSQRRPAKDQKQVRRLHRRLLGLSLASD